jgi:hypothetical protein
MNDAGGGKTNKKKVKSKTDKDPVLAKDARIEPPRFLLTR